MSGILSILSTPIGNLEDMTLRGLRILKEADAIACEDTRVTSQILQRYEIPSKPFVSINQHSRDQAISGVLDRIEQGEKIAYASDAGTPNVNDPGGRLIELAYERGIKIEVIPGPSALTAAMACCGFAMEHFRYVGFIPMKKHRASLLKSMADDEEPTVFFESTHRIIKTIQELAVQTGPDRMIYIGRELTKHFETHYRDSISAVLNTLEKGSTKGEFVCILGPKQKLEKNTILE
jgi:16S rRNA (cytidine1402-2'-O)-methyltransferase